MNMNPSKSNRMIAAAVSFFLLATVASSTQAAVTERIEPGEISLGGTAELTIESSDATTTRLAPPAVPGLDFVAVGQSTQMQSINGQTSLSSSVIYQVTAQRVGIFTIPSATQKSPPLVLRVEPDTTRGLAAVPSSSSASAQDPSNGSSAGAMQMTQDGSAFVRLGMAKQELYVGESIPVDIQVGVRTGMAASLDGLPTLNGDAFTLDKLSSEPKREPEVVDGNSFTVLTWRSDLMAVKPGALALTIKTPLTVRYRESTRSTVRRWGDASIDDVLRDPFIQNFFGRTTERNIIATSAPIEFTVRELPLEHRPAGFTGAVGQFNVTSGVSAATATVGDPITLTLNITGAGNFDRVATAMLGSVPGWKTYPPTERFTPANTTRDRGEKTFEQPVIATLPGTQTLPSLTFSYFDPVTHHYETAQTLPLNVTVSPTSEDSAQVSQVQPVASSAAVSLGAGKPTGLRPDHVERGATEASLVPFYFQPRFLTIPSILMLAFVGAWIVIRRREQTASDSGASRQRETSLAAAALTEQMDEASAKGDIALFVAIARSALQQVLGARWHVTPQSISLPDLDARLGTDIGAVRNVFALADEARYAGRVPTPVDTQQWKAIVLRQLRIGRKP